MGRSERKSRRRTSRRQGESLRTTGITEGEPHPRNPPQTFSIPRDQLAPGGISGDIFTVVVDGSMPRGSGLPMLQDREERVFELTTQLLRDTGFARDVTFDATPAQGTSFFGAPEGVDRVVMSIPEGSFSFIVNERHEFAGVKGSVRTSTPQQARSIFLRAVSPVVDHLAYVGNAPLILGNTVCVDRKNGVVGVGYIAPYNTVVLSEGQMSFRKELAGVYALYREAKNTSSAFYRILCYFKILEGIYSTIRPRTFLTAKERGVVLTRRKEVIPDHPELRKFAPALITSPVKEYFDNTLQKEFRDKVAHYILDSGALLNPSNPDDHYRFANVILPAELCCRVVVDQEEAYLRELDGATPQ